MIKRTTELERQLIARISQTGPITFRDFMREALYNPKHGYYNTGRSKIGPEGDYYTSSNVHPAFGAVLARAMAQLVGESKQTPLSVIEFGAGTGRLAFDIITALRDEHPSMFERLDYAIVEASPVMRDRQRELLRAFGERLVWRTVEELESDSITGIVFSNELIDAMPVHLVRLKGGIIEEMYVTTGKGSEEARLALDWGDVSTAKLAEYINRFVSASSERTLSDGRVVEINLDALDWLAGVARLIKRGFLITIDYGDTSEHLYSEDRIRGTLRSFYRHRLTRSPLERVGDQDITASVNFTALIESGRDCGLELVSYERQTAFLMRMGLIERIARMQGASGALDDIKERLALKNLFVPGGVSDNFRVLIQRKEGGQ